VIRRSSVCAIVAFAAFTALVGCGRAEPAPGPVTIPDPKVFLVQLRCPDGSLELAEPSCPGAAPQRASDPMRMRRHD
jgi:hypothetical protein